MEFETKPGAQPGIDEDAARLAAAKHVTLTPIHDNIAPEDLPDEQAGLYHGLSPAIPNATIDSEVTIPQSHPAASSPSLEKPLAPSQGVAASAQYSPFQNSTPATRAKPRSHRYVLLTTVIVVLIVLGLGALVWLTT